MCSITYFQTSLGSETINILELITNASVISGILLCVPVYFHEGWAKVNMGNGDKYLIC